MRTTIELSPLEQLAIARYQARIEAGNAARQALTVLSNVIIARAGGDTTKQWRTTEDGTAIVEAQNGVAQ